MQSQAALYTATVDILRKDLISYGAVISSLANQTKQQRREIAALAGYLHNFLSAHTTESSPSIKSNNPTLPEISLKALDARACLCLQCSPGHSKQVKDQAVKEASKHYEEMVAENTKQRLRLYYEDKYAQEVKTEVLNSIRAKLKDKILKEELVTYKQQLTRKIQNEWKNDARAKISAELDDQYAAKFKQMMDSFNSK